jgi:hypothetical protein
LLQNRFLPSFRDLLPVHDPVISHSFQFLVWCFKKLVTLKFVIVIIFHLSYGQNCV